MDAPLNSPDDWPSHRRVSDAEWQAVLARLHDSHSAFGKAMEKCSDQRLKQKVPGSQVDSYTLLHGTIHHCVYHTAQIVLLKNAAAAKTPRA